MARRITWGVGGDVESRCGWRYGIKVWVEESRCGWRCGIKVWVEMWNQGVGGGMESRCGWRSQGVSGDVESRCGWRCGIKVWVEESSEVQVVTWGVGGGVSMGGGVK